MMKQIYTCDACAKTASSEEGAYLPPGWLRLGLNVFLTTGRHPEHAPVVEDRDYHCCSPDCGKQLAVKIVSGDWEKISAITPKTGERAARPVS